MDFKSNQLWVDPLSGSFICTMTTNLSTIGYLKIECTCYFSIIKK